MIFQVESTSLLPSAPASFSNAEEFNALARTLSGSPDDSSKSSDLFTSKLAEISSGLNKSFPTPWGGVALQKVEEPLVEKFLVVRGGNYLAFEKHDQKEEWLSLVEGEAVLMHKKSGSDIVSIISMKPGEQIFIAPGEEHCLCARTNAVVFERGFDHKGMDQDLIFIYLPD